jgi:hypothetical protein
MAIPVALAIGEHLLLADPATAWTVQFSEANPASVILTASIQSGPKPPIYPGPLGATSVAIQMEQQVAMQLYKQLRELGRSMGWLPHIEDASQA